MDMLGFLLEAKHRGAALQASAGLRVGWSMSLDQDAFQRGIEEFKEVGHEYRYREQLMVQEFGLSMAVAGVLIGAITARAGTVEGVVIQVFGLLFLSLLTLHLRNINEDRLAAIERREELRSTLEFARTHQNVAGKRRWSAPRLMVWFSRLSAVAWAVWTVLSLAARP
jgi:hypothetical protein